MSEKSVFMTLSAIDVTGKLKKKNGMDYLPWSSAWAIVKELYPDAHYDVHKNESGWLYHTDGKTCWVEVSVTIQGETQTETLAVMNHRNTSIAADEVMSTEANKSIKRALVKCLALFGLGLSLWNGEELSDTAKKARADKKAAEDKQRQADEAALAEIHQKIIDAASSKKDAGVDVEAIYAIVQKYAGGKKNPKAIKDINDARSCLDEVVAYQD